ncbi:MAG: flagellar hook-associated protein FlgL [Gammaproteobacteria bacterium]|nr:flagellar hook-associated protein FlgL [Gammaproteobacteria bacterium]
MRISTSFFYAQGLNTMLDQQAKLLRIQDQVGQGVKLLSPSDDPSATARVLGIGQSITKIAQYSENSIYAKQRLELEDSTLDSVSLALHRIRELAVQAGNIGTGDDQTRRANTAEIKQRIDEIFDLANRRDVNGDYLFSGYKSQTRPFYIDGQGKYIYNGDQGQMGIKIGNTRQVKVSDSGSDIFQKVRTGNGSFAVDSGLVNTGSGVIHEGSVSDTRDFVAHDYMMTFRQQDELRSAKFTAAAAPLSLDYSVAPATFDISVHGAVAVPITFNLNMAAEPPLVIAKAVASEINTQLGEDLVKGYVDAAGNMVIESLEKDGLNSSITFSNLAGTAASLGLQAINVSGTNPPVREEKFFDIIDLNLSPGTVTSADLGLGGVDIYDADQPAVVTGLANLSLGADFDTGGPTAFTLNVNGQTRTVNLDGLHNAGSLPGYLQERVNVAFGDNAVKVSRNGAGNIVLTTFEEGAEIDLRVVGFSNNVLGLVANDYDSGIDRNNQLKIYVDGDKTPVKIDLTAGLGISASAIAAEINAAAGINAIAPNTPLTEEIVINSDQFGLTDNASLVFQGSALETLGINIVNSIVGAPAREYIENQSYIFDGHNVSIEGAPEGDDVFTVKASRHQDIFTTLRELVNDLEEPPNEENGVSMLAQLAQRIAISLSNISQASDNVVSSRTAIGARLNIVESQEGQNESQKNQLEKIRSDIIDLDYAEAISQLNFQMTAFQAAQQSFAQIQQLSLFDYI